MADRRAGRPYLSIVATSRNDDHGGGLLERMQLFVDSLFAQCRRFALDAELILVEWNPPRDRPPLAKALVWPEAAGSCEARIVEVPREIHARYRFSDHLPLFQMTAKNAGIRRARGRYVLATNIDILFSDDLIAWLAGKKLEPGRFYRVDRYDIPAPPPGDASPGERLRWCNERAIRVARRDGVYVRAGGGRDPYRRSTPTAAGLVVANFRRAVNEMNGTGRLAPLRYARAAAGVGVKGLRAMGQVLRDRPLHTNACGDFTLMARDDWFALRGYPEFEMYSWHIDSVLLHHARRRGLKQRILSPPLAIFHLEHDGGWTPDGQQALFERLARAGVAHLTDDDLRAIVADLRRSAPDFVFNGPGWGLAEETLDETDPVRARERRPESRPLPPFTNQPLADGR